MGFNMLFKLTSVYEYFLPAKDQPDKLVRLEIFNSVEETDIYRVRVWLQNTYNLYPTLINIDSQGNDLMSIHSSDDLNQDITSIVFSDGEIILGKRFSDEDSLINHAKDNIDIFFNELN
jgi:hypothetical protein